ncbi:MAG: ferredoxin-nitrite reductase [Anaerocolumna sp.]|jgi:ferredoxin-nitrite reductase|nr:ferredoxin-nitrite reductase [Anaerocolumna sp.]
MDRIDINKLEEMIEERKKVYRDDIDYFKKVGHDFLEGNKTSAEFKAVSGGMGVYAQRSQKEFMIRLRVLSGVLDYDTLQLIQEFANSYSLKTIHFTTRQAIQLHDLQFNDVISIMEKGLEQNLITRGGGGNYPRNVSLSPLSGVEKDEAFDVTPYAILVNKYFLSRMDTYKLPRKYKVAFSNNSSDTACATATDLGFIAVKVDGKNYFKVFIGGSLGVNGDISVPFDELVLPEEILYHLEASLSLLVTEGDFENKSKARMRFIVKRMGKEAFLACYKEHLQQIKEKLKLEFSINEYDPEYKDIEQRVVNTIMQPIDDLNKFDRIDEDIIKQPDVIAQKQVGRYTLVLHPQGGILKTEYLNKIVDFLKDIPDSSIRLGMEESMYIRNLTAAQTLQLMDITKEIRQITRLEQSISCIGIPTCQIGVQESQGLLNSILVYFKEKKFYDDVLPALHISGCVNSCGRHQINEIGFQGKKKRVNDVAADAYALFISGKTSETDTHLGKECGDLLAESIPAFLYELATNLKEKQIDFSTFIENNSKEFESILKPYLV